MVVNFLKYSKELKDVLSFKNNLIELNKIEENFWNDYSSKNKGFGISLNSRQIQSFIQRKCESQSLEYKLLRTKIAQEIPKIKRIANNIAIPTGRWSQLGRHEPVLVDVFESVLEDYGYEPTQHRTREDTIDRMIGILNEAKSSAFRRLFNPLNWISLLLRIPFLIVQQTGFNVLKIEDQIIGRGFKLLFLLIGIYVLFRLGFSKEDIIQLVGR